MATRKEWRKRKEIIKSAKETAEDGKSKKNDRIIDVTKIYTEYEDELSKSERKRKGPEGLKLKDFDVNLRKYRMVGGVYCIEYVKQPQQDMKLNSKKYLRTGGAMIPTCSLAGRMSQVVFNFSFLSQLFTKKTFPPNIQTPSSGSARGSETTRRN